MGRFLYRFFWFLVVAHTLGALFVYLAGDGGVGSKGTDVSIGKKLYQDKACAACHGDEGVKPKVAGYPHLAGQPASYLETQMRDIRSGRRNNGMTQLMKPIMLPISDEEIRELARYLESVSP